MKQLDFQSCAICQQGMMHTGLPVFYRLHVETMGIDIKAVDRQAGFERFMGGNAALAYHMGPQETMAEPIYEGTTLLLCHACAMDHETDFLQILAAVEARAESAASKESESGTP